MYISSIDFNKKNYSGYSSSVSFGNSHFLKYVNLLKRGSLEEIKKLRNVNALGENGETLLHVASGIASLETVLFLSEKRFRIRLIICVKRNEDTLHVDCKSSLLSNKLKN